MAGGSKSVVPAAHSDADGTALHVRVYLEVGDGSVSGDLGEKVNSSLVSTHSLPVPS